MGLLTKLANRDIASLGGVLRYQPHLVVHPLRDFDGSDGRYPW